MKLKKLIYILLILLLVPCAVTAVDYPYLPTGLKMKAISVFGINTAGKTMLYEKVNIYEDFDAWMIGWFDDSVKTIVGITDTEDIIYYNVSGFDNTPVYQTGKGISAEEGEKTALNFLRRIMPEAEPVLLSSKAFEYIYTDSYNSIPILGREATVVVDKLSGKITYYKGFGQTDCRFDKLTDSLITPEHAFEKFYENIGLELVYNTVFDHSTRTKAIRPMYILNRKGFKAVTADSGKIVSVSMKDYNYYYSDDFFIPGHYYDNNIYTEEKVFSPDGKVSASDYKLSQLMNMPGLGLSEGYCGRVVPGILHFYTSADGSENSRPALRVDVVPTSQAINIFKFSDKFDSGNTEWFSTISCKTPLVFARAYVDPKSGNLLDFETVKNAAYIPAETENLTLSLIDRLVSDSAEYKTVKFYGSQTSPAGLTHLVYARYANGARVIGEGASVIYDSVLGSITDFTLSVSNGDFLSPSFMKTPKEMKEFVKDELRLRLYYVDKNEHTKYVIYDPTDKNIAFDPLTGDRINKLDSPTSPVIVVLNVGKDEYTINGIPLNFAPPVISSEKLFVPAKVVSAALGYYISGSEDEFIISNEKDHIRLSPDSATCILNGEELVLDAPPVMVSDELYVSAGSLRNLFGMFVRWDSIDGKIYLIR